MGATTKRCARCRRMKSLAKFGSNVRMPNGLNIYCKECVSAQSKEFHRRRKQGKLGQRGRPRTASITTVTDVVDATATVRVSRIERILQEHEAYVNERAAWT